MTIGQQLREAREKKGVSIEKAAEETKVKGDVLRALEADDYSKMLAPVYVKGFLKIYSQYLDLDPVAVRQQYESSATGRPAAAPLHRAASHLGQSPVDKILSSFATMWGVWFLVGGICIVLVLIVWVVISTIKRAHFDEGKPPATATAAPKPKPAHTTTTIAPRVEAPKPGTPPATPAPPAEAFIKPSQPKPAVLDPKLQTAPPSRAPASSPSSAAPASAPLVVSVQLIEESWVEVTVDGKKLPYRTQKAGWSNHWRANKSIALRLGNAGGARVTFNGKELPPLGKRGQPVTRTFSK